MILRGMSGASIGASSGGMSGASYVGCISQYPSSGQCTDTISSKKLLHSLNMLKSRLLISDGHNALQCFSFCSLVFNSFRFHS